MRAISSNNNREVALFDSVWSLISKLRTITKYLINLSIRKYFLIWLKLNRRHIHGLILNILFSKKPFFFEEPFRSISWTNCLSWCCKREANYLYFFCSAFNYFIKHLYNPDFIFKFKKRSYVINKDFNFNIQVTWVLNRET